MCDIEVLEHNPASILYKSIAGRYRPVSYPDGPITARYRFMSNAYWEYQSTRIILQVQPYNIGES